MAKKNKKDDPFAYLQELIAAPRPQDPYASLSTSLPVKVSSSASAKDLLSKLGTVQTNRAVLQALGVEEEKPKVAPGIVSTLLSPEKGLFFAPARFGSALLADVTGLGEKTEFASELQGYALEDAFRAARGEFAITGGDIIKVNDRDNLITKGGKLLGALAWDLATDPTSYLGGVTSLSRKTLVEAAANPERMKRVIQSAEKAVAQRGLSKSVSDNFLKELLLYNRRFTDGELTILTSGRGRNAHFKVVRALDEVPIPDEEVMQIAATSLSNIVSEGLIYRGRAGVLDNLRAVFNTKTAPDLAEEIFENALPRELQGGLYLVNPITGTRYKKIAGGHGSSNLATELLNKARFQTARGMRGVTRQISGEYGGAWADAMRDLHKDIVRTKGNSRNLISDYVTFKTSMQRKEELVERLSAPVLNWSKQTIAVANDIEEKFGKKAADTFKQRLGYYAYESQDYTEDKLAEIAGRAADVGTLRSKEYADYMAEVWGAKGAQIFKMYADTLKAAGVPLKQQKKYLPLMYTQEAMEYLMRAEPRQGKDLRGLYSAEKPRVTFESPQDAEALAALFEDDAIRIFDSPSAANARARRIVNPDTGKPIKWFEEDVSILLSRYGNWAANRVATERTIKALEITGVVRRYIPETIEQVNASNAEVWLETARTLDQGNRGKLKAIVDSADAKIREMTDQSYVNDENRKRAEVLAAAQFQYDKAIEAEMSTFKEIVQLEKFLRDNNILDADILDELLNGVPDVDRAILEVVLADIKTAQRKAARWHDRLEKHVEAYGKAKKARTAARSKATKAKFAVDPKTGKRKRVAVPQQIKDALERAEDEVLDIEDSILNAEGEWIQAATNVKSLAADRNSIRNAIAQADAARVARAQELIGPYLAALDRKQVLVAKLEVERAARQTARTVRNAARVDVVNLNSKAIGIAIDAYARNRQAFKDIAYTLRHIKREEWTFEQKRQYGFRLKAMRKSRSKLIKTIGYSAGGRQTAGREYARELMRLIQEKTDTNIALMRFFSNDDAIDEFVRRLMSTTADSVTRAEAMRDLMRAYAYLRNVVTDEDLRKLGSLERNLFLRKGKERPLDVFTGPPTARISILQDDLARAKARGDKAEATRLRARLKMLKSRMDDEGLSLVGGGEAGFAAPRALRDLYAPSGVREIMEEMWRMRETPDEWERYIRSFYDPLAFLWKTQATVGRGFGYIFNNLIGGTANNYLYGVTIQDNKEAAAILGAFLEARAKFAAAAVPDVNEAITKDFSAKLAKLQIGEHEAAKVLIDFMRSGSWFSTETVTTLRDVASTGYATKLDDAGAGRLGIAFEWQDAARSTKEEEFRRFVDFMLTNPIQRMFNDLAQRSEVFVRLAAFIRGYKNYGNADSATAVVKALHFDYKDLSVAEQWVKRFVPFYTWNRNNLPLQLRALFFQPDKIKRMVLVNENFKKAFGEDEEDSWIQELLPDWVDVQGGFLSNFSFMDNPIGLFPRLPLYDLDKTLQVVDINGFPVIAPRFEQVGGMLGPAVTPIEFMVGVNFDTGLKYADEGEKWSRMATNLAPMVGTLTRYGRAATVPLSVAGVDLPDVIKQERGMTDLLNLTIGNAVGYSAFTYTEKQMMSGLLDKIEKQNEQIKQVAADANIDLEWLRSQIKAGKSLFEIKMLLAQGKGNADLWAQIRELEGLKEPSRDYQAVIAGLRSGQPMTGYGSPD